ncbi:MAG: NAD-dependent epimerase/dehydratase family protein [Candidatus Eisenbacteria bacterium]|nr:NAD-dependent epimerase/dehydratase family protein [Candidatus Latescibacterota bacterium]MBD3302066.1 NAD-dependent epimerase/dehydratase family protein [Candidatus Eisenbacteria bacterium]
MEIGKVLVTGGAGFIGSHVAERLLREGLAVRILDDLSTGHRENVEAIRSGATEKLELAIGDVRSPETVEEATRDVGAIVHLAALPSVERSVQDPWTSHAVNVDGTLHLLEAARARKIGRFVLAGSSSVYGDQPELPKTETMRPAPRSPYALSKFVAEEYVRLYAELFGLPGITLRYFNVFGPRQDPASPYAAVIPLFLKALRKGEPPVIFGDGEQTRDFTFVENVVEANLAALSGPPPHGEAVNVACGERTSLLELLELLVQATGTPGKPTFAPPRAGDVRDSMASIERATELLGYRPRVGLREGIERTVAAFPQD